ncbi:hypothetical protein COO60DRAFT_362880 [Scenedesmus sp. NREL 46B-D3]|nr:hypothetical protein COO60DRAFT_362880 [Scenedesmus sp. NREL 46B-D3]
MGGRVFRLRNPWDWPCCCACSTIGCLVFVNPCLTMALVLAAAGCSCLMFPVSQRCLAARAVSLLARGWQVYICCCYIVAVAAFVPVPKQCTPFWLHSVQHGQLALVRL